MTRRRYTISFFHNVGDVLHVHSGLVEKTKSVNIMKTLWVHHNLLIEQYEINAKIIEVNFFQIGHFYNINMINK